MAFEDNFSKQAGLYARHRPQYPQTLYAFLASQAPGRERAWDCATGNGQAARGLASFFERVIATDASLAQVEKAAGSSRIDYLVAQAESSGLPGASVDLISVAQALHWFDLERFYAEARRVLKPGGLLAAWCYHLIEISPEIDPVFAHFFNVTVGPYWSAKVRLANEHYQTIPFPFAEIHAPGFAIETEWDLDQLLSYMASWSSVQKYIEANGRSPLPEFEAQAAGLWGERREKKKMKWPLYMRVGRTEEFVHGQ